MASTSGSIIVSASCHNRPQLVHAGLSLTSHCIVYEMLHIEIAPKTYWVPIAFTVLLWLILLSVFCLQILHLPTLQIDINWLQLVQMSLHLCIYIARG
jgi:hypothetical protein